MWCQVVLTKHFVAFTVFFVGAQRAGSGDLLLWSERQ